MKLNKILLVGLSLFFFASCATSEKTLDSKSVRTIKRKHTVNEQYLRALDYYETKRYDKALSLFYNIEEAYRGHQRIDTIMFYSANCHYFDKDYITSSEMYNAYRITMGRGEFAELADLYYALSLYKVSPDVELDQTYTGLAISAFGDFIYRNPGHEMIPQCEQYISELQLRLYENDFDIAKTYYNIGYYNSCLQVLDNILQNDPNTPFREEVLFMIVKTNYEYARMSVPSKRLERFYGVIDGYYRFVEEYPNSKLLDKAKKHHKHAVGFADGTSVVNEVTGQVMSKKNDLYERKKKLESDIEKYKKKKNKKKSKELQDSAEAELSALQNIINKFEEIQEKRNREVELNKAN